MLNPKSHRLDYGEHLSPPAGYELDCAIATTYSLDLDALLAIPVALCFHDTLEGDLRGERLALLEAIGQLKGRIKVFYQAGKVKLPATYNRLFALLEPCLQPILPSGGVYSSFHPKLWLLRYLSSEGDVKYRLLVLSRNLTFDRSWDIAVSLDGQLLTQSEATKSTWTRFVEGLLGKAADFEAGSVLADEVGRIQWQPPSGFWDPRLIPGGPEFGAPLELLQPSDQLLVVSPFLKDSGGFVAALDELAKQYPDGKRLLFSRAEELNSIGQDKLEAWLCFSINEDIVDGEERLELSEIKQNLHAKLIVNQRGQTTHWHVGSANATSAALGKAGSSPRNDEFMLRLTGRTPVVGPEVLVRDWVGDSDNPGLFVPHNFVSVDADDSADFRDSIRKAVYLLTKATWVLTAEHDEQGTYHLKLDIDQVEQISEALQVEVGQLAITNAYKDFATQIEWTGVNLSQISALVPVRVRAGDERLGNSISEQLVIQVILRLPMGVNREQSLLAELVDSESKFLNYIRLLLQRQPDKNEWLGYDTQQGQQDGLYALFDDSPLFEQLMDAAARHPDALKRIAKLLKRIHDTGVPIPEAFQKLWPHFESTIR